MSPLTSTKAICAFMSRRIVAWPFVAGTPPVSRRAVTTLVLIDAATQRPRRLSDDERAVWGRYLGEPPAMRRRGPG